MSLGSAKAVRVLFLNGRAGGSGPILLLVDVPQALSEKLGLQLNASSSTLPPAVTGRCWCPGVCKG